jgi:hypothetical protein
MDTWGIKLGTRPAGAIEDPSPVSVGDIRWFREAGTTRHNPKIGKLYRRRVKDADEVRVDRIILGYIMVSYHP